MITKILPVGTKILVRGYATVSNILFINDRAKPTEADRITHNEIVSIGDQVDASKFPIGANTLFNYESGYPISVGDDPLDIKNMRKLMEENKKDINATLSVKVHSYFLIDSFNIISLYTYVPDPEIKSKSGLVLT